MIRLEELKKKNETIRKSKYKNHKRYAILCTVINIATGMKLNTGNS